MGWLTSRTPDLLDALAPGAPLDPVPVCSPGDQEPGVVPTLAEDGFIVDVCGLESVHREVK